MTLPTPPSRKEPIPNSSPIVTPKVQPVPPSPPQGSGVERVESGVGISVSRNTGRVRLRNTGVTSLVAGQGVNLSASTGEITISAKSAGTVCSINTGKGLVGGPITATGTIALANSGVKPGIYNLANIAVDEYGRVTAATNGAAITQLTASLPVRVSNEDIPNISIDRASLTHPGIVRLSDSTSNLSSETAASSLAVKIAYDAATAAIPSKVIADKGTLVVGLAAGVPVSLRAGEDGQVLTANSRAVHGLAWKSQPKGITERVQIGDRTLVIEEGVITEVI